MSVPASSFGSKPRALPTGAAWKRLNASCRGCRSQDDAGFCSGILSCDSGVLVKLPEEVRLPRLRATGADVCGRGRGRGPCGPIDGEIRVPADLGKEGLQFARLPEGFLPMQCWLLPVRVKHVQPDDMEALRQARRARQALEAVREP